MGSLNEIIINMFVFVGLMLFGFWLYMRHRVQTTDRSGNEGENAD